jgi:hypothetical protein
MNRQNWSWKGRSVATLIAAVAVAVLGVRASIASADNGDRRDHPDEPIVGFWQVTFTDKDTKKVTSYVWDAWHSDRTEVQNDSDNILAGNVCQGAWVPLGNRTYGLTHPAFVFADPTHPESGGTEDNEGQFVGYTCVILERVTVNESGNNYAGPGVVKCVAGVDPFDPAADVVFTQRLTIKAKRVSVDVSQLPSSD